MDRPSTMSATGGPATWPPHQRAIWERCRHPSGMFVDFPLTAVEQSIPERFAAQVRQHSDRPAVIGARGVLTYADLDRRANGVAQALLEQGGPGSESVAFLLDRDLSLLAAALGVLKAGKFYVPLDDALPDEALAAYLDSARPRFVLVDRSHADRMGALGRIAAVVLDVDALAAEAPATCPEVDIEPGARALVLYTSGSMGRPKGVVHTHRTVLHMVMNHTRHLHICAEDRLTLLFSLAFVGSVSDVFGALLNGAAVCPVDLRDGLTAAAARLASGGATIYHSVTTAFRQFAESLPVGPCLPSVRLLHVGGEPVTSRDLDAYRVRFAPECVLVNMLGTTETGNFRIHFVDRAAAVAGPTVPVGFGFADKDVLVLDEVGGAVPPGSVGEIVVRSRYLSPGYWRAPELTDAAFSADPDDPSARRYRTGDLGSLGADGCLEHHGRADRQVKIRGYRVETAAVEAALRAHPGVRDVAVLAEGAPSADQRLIAYVVPVAAASLGGAALREFATARLAGYMVPSAFVLLEALPLTHTGKVDRRRLPAVSRARPDLPEPFVAPRSPLERALAALWAETLDLDVVGVRDTFIELGGTSLLALQLAERLQARWRASLSLQVILRAATVEQMAQALLEHLAAGMGTDTLSALVSRIERGNAG